MDEQYQALLTEIEQLKKRVSLLEEWVTVSAEAVVPPEPEKKAELPRPEPEPLPPRPERQYRPEKKPSSLKMSEEKLAGTWFNRLGILAIMLAVVFFLKWSFDNNLIGELGRIVIGIICGLGFLGAGEYFQRRKFHIYGQGFSGGGIAILYFSIFSAFTFYYLISQPVAFGLMVLITLAASLLAIRYDSRTIGIIGIVGGFATPFLLSSGESNRLILYTYIAILDAGVLLIAYFKKWPLFNYLTFFFTYITYLAGLSAIHLLGYFRSFDALSFSYLTLFFLIYLGVSFTRNICFRESFLGADITLILLNAASYFMLSYNLLSPHFKDWIGYWAVFLGLIYLLLGLFVYRRFAGTRKLSLTLLAVAAGFITIAVPLQLDGYWISMAWAVEAVLVFYLNLQFNTGKIPLAGLIILAITVFSLFAEPFVISGEEIWIFLNKGAVAYLVVILVMAFILWLCYYFQLSGIPWGNSMMLVLQISLNLLIVLFLTLEIGAYYDYLRFQQKYREAYLVLNSQNLVLSLVWGLHAALLVVLGFWRRLKGIRLFGLGFLCLVILKVFFFDLSNLTTPNRILSFVGLGLILLAVSWLYHRYKDLILGGDNDESRQEG
jgi:uncharacterized membrane protein